MRKGRTTIDRGERERGVERGSGEPNRGRRVKTPDVIDRVLPWGRRVFGYACLSGICKPGGLHAVCQRKQPHVATPVVRVRTGPSVRG